MMEYLLLANPGHNRVYLDAAQGAAAAELSRLLPGCQVESTQLCGQPALRLTCEQPLEEGERNACARSSLFYALFEGAGEGLLRPVEVPQWQYLPDSLKDVVYYQFGNNKAEQAALEFRKKQRGIK